MDRFSSMEAFVKVVADGGFAPASRGLRISPAMVGKHVRGLEARLGVRLLNRTTRAVSLTEAGRAYHARCVAILHSIAEAERTAEASNERPRGPLRITVPVGATASWIGPAIADFAATYPDVAMDVVCEDRVADLVQERFDVAIRIGVLSNSSMVARKLAPVALVLCAAPTYLARSGTPRTIEDLSKHSGLAYAYQWAGDGWSLNGEDGAERVVHMMNPVHRSNNGSVIQALALRGAGIAQLPLFMVEVDLAAGHLVEILPDRRPQDRWIHVIYPSGQQPVRTVRAFVDHLVPNCKAAQMAATAEGEIPRYREAAS